MDGMHGLHDFMGGLVLEDLPGADGNLTAAPVIGRSGEAEETLGELLQDDSEGLHQRGAAPLHVP